MARIFTRIERMIPFLYRRKTSIFLLFIAILSYKGIMYILSRPKLYDVAMATLEKSDAILNARDDDTECSVRMYNVASYLALLRGVIVDPKFAHKLPKDRNHLKLMKGFFSLECKGNTDFASSVHYNRFSHFYTWAKAVLVTSSEEDEVDIVEGLSFVVKRRNSDPYVKLLDVYNTYVTARMLAQKPKDSNIVFLDAYMDDPDMLWSIAFGETIQFQEIHGKVRFERLIWAVPADLGPIETLDQPIPYLEDFRHHVVTMGGAVSSDEVTCQSLRITLLASSDEKSKGETITLANMADIAQKLAKELPNHEITTISPNEVDMRQLIQTIAKTDILIGVHGFDLTNVVFLHKGSGLIELFPTRHRLISNNRYRQLAKWSSVYYQNWYNLDLLFRDTTQMTVSPDTVLYLVQKMGNRICS